MPVDIPQHILGLTRLHLRQLTPEWMMAVPSLRLGLMLAPVQVQVFLVVGVRSGEVVMLLDILLLVQLIIRLLLRRTMQPVQGIRLLPLLIALLPLHIHLLLRRILLPRLLIVPLPLLIVRPVPHIALHPQPTVPLPRLIVLQVRLILRLPRHIRLLVQPTPLLRLLIVPPVQRIHLQALLIVRLVLLIVRLVLLIVLLVLLIVLLVLLIVRHLLLTVPLHLPIALLHLHIVLRLRLIRQAPQLIHQDLQDTIHLLGQLPTILVDHQGLIVTRAPPPLIIQLNQMIRGSVKTVIILNDMIWIWI